MKNYDWIIIGGGIAGISIAEYISRTNKNILLIEKNSKLCAETTAEFHEWTHAGSLYTLKNKDFMALNYLTELSTPFLNKSFDLAEQNKENTYEYKVINTLVVIIFGISRVFMIPYLIYKTLDFSNNILVCQTILSSMNIIWHYKICKYYRKLISGNLKKKN